MTIAPFTVRPDVAGRGRKPIPWRERILKFIDRRDVAECWPWLGTKRQDGYGYFWRDGVRVYAHRAVRELFFGGIPDGAVVRHSCDNPRCVNPMHLLTGSHLDNMRDCIERGRRRNRVFERCKCGREFDAITSTGVRRCKACMSARHAKWLSGHVEEVRARVKARYAANAESEKARSSLWRKANRERSRELNRKSYARHKEQNAAKARAYRERMRQERSIA
jgi:hypothetical protein